MLFLFIIIFVLVYSLVERRLFLVGDSCLYEVNEEWVWLQYRALVLWVILCSDVPLQAWYLHNLHQVAFWVATHAHHAMLLKLLLELVVELIAMAVTLLDVLLLIYIEHARTLF